MFEAQVHHVISASGGFTMAQKRLWTKLWKDGASSTGRLTWHVFSKKKIELHGGRMVSYLSVGVVHGVGAKFLTPPGPLDFKPKALHCLDVKRHQF